MLTITMTELKENLSKYVNIARTEDVAVSMNGRIIVHLVNPHENRVREMESLFGCIPAETDADRILEDRMDDLI